MNRIPGGNRFLPFPIILLASIVYATGFHWCYSPNEIGFGGLTGVSQIIHHFFPFLSIGMMVLIFNIPLFLLGWKLLGTQLLVRSLFAMLCTSILLDVVSSLYTFPPMDPLLAAIFGGLLIGGSVGVIFSQSATTGGSDLIARLLKLKLRWIPLGKLLMMVDLVVIVAVAIAFQNLSSALYGIVALYISSLVTDWILYGPVTAKMAYIISSRPEDMTKAIVEDLERGVTLIHGQGAYSGVDKKIIFCAFKRHQISALKQLIREIDPDAFFIVCDAREILGDGFGDIYRTDI